MPIDPRLPADFPKNMNDIQRRLKAMIEFIEKHPFDPDDGHLPPPSGAVVFFACFPGDRAKAKVTPIVFLAALKDVKDRVCSLVEDFDKQFK
jgi:hypothetical protein